MKDIVRESVNRTRSERLIDRHMPTTRPAPEVAQAPTNVDKATAFNKIVRHIPDVKRYQKCIELLSKLVKKYHHRLEQAKILDCLRIIYQSGHINKPPRKLTQEIFKFIRSHYYEGLNEDEKLEFDRWTYLAIDINAIFTDDSHQFHKNLKWLTQQLGELESDQWLNVYFEGIFSLREYLQLPWSKTGLKNLYRKVIGATDKFSSLQREKLAQLLAEDLERAPPPVLQLPSLFQ